MQVYSVQGSNKVTYISLSIVPAVIPLCCPLRAHSCHLQFGPCHQSSLSIFNCVKRTDSRGWFGVLYNTPWRRTHMIENQSYCLQVRCILFHLSLSSIYHLCLCYILQYKDTWAHPDYLVLVSCFRNSRMRSSPVTRAQWNANPSKRSQCFSPSQLWQLIGSKDESLHPPRQAMSKENLKRQNSHYRLWCIHITKSVTPRYAFIVCRKMSLLEEAGRVLDQVTEANVSCPSTNQWQVLMHIPLLWYCGPKAGKA